MKITAIDRFILAVTTRKPTALRYPLQKRVCARISTAGGLKALLPGEYPRYVERLWEKMLPADMSIKQQGVADGSEV